MKQELGIRDFTFLRVIFITLQLTLSFYLAYAWDKNEYAQWVTFQTQFALIVQLNFGIPVYFNKYTAIKKKEYKQKISLLFPWILVMIVSAIVSNQVFITFWAGLGIIQLTLTSGMRSLKFDLSPTVLAILLPFLAIVSAIIFKTACALLWTYILTLILICFILLFIYRRNFIIPLGLETQSTLEITRIWIYNLLFYGVYEFTRNQITTQSSIEEKVNLGYLFILLGAVTAVWSIFSSYYYPQLLRSSMEDNIQGIKRIYKILGIILILLFVTVVTVNLLGSLYFEIHLRYELIYLYLLMCLAGMLGTYSVGRNNLMSFFRDIGVFSIMIGIFSPALTMLQISTALFIGIIVRQIVSIFSKLRQYD